MYFHELNNCFVVLILILLKDCMCIVNANKLKKTSYYNRVGDFDDIVENPTINDVSTTSTTKSKHNTLPFPYWRHKKYAQRIKKDVLSTNENNLPQDSLDYVNKVFLSEINDLNNKMLNYKPKLTKRKSNNYRNFRNNGPSYRSFKGLKSSVCDCSNPSNKCRNCHLYRSPNSNKLQRISPRKVGPVRLLLKLIKPGDYQSKPNLKFRNKRNLKRTMMKRKSENGDGLDLHVFEHMLKLIDQNKSLSFTEDYTYVPVIFATLDQSMISPGLDNELNENSIQKYDEIGPDHNEGDTTECTTLEPQMQSSLELEGEAEKCTIEMERSSTDSERCSTETERCISTESERCSSTESEKCSTESQKSSVETERSSIEIEKSSLEREGPSVEKEVCTSEGPMGMYKGEVMGGAKAGIAYSLSTSTVCKVEETVTVTNVEQTGTVSSIKETISTAEGTGTVPKVEKVAGSYEPIIKGLCTAPVTIPQKPSEKTLYHHDFFTTEAVSEPVTGSNEHPTTETNSNELTTVALHVTTPTPTVDEVLRCSKSVEGNTMEILECTKVWPDTDHNTEKIEIIFDTLSDSELKSNASNTPSAEFLTVITNVEENPQENAEQPAKLAHDELKFRLPNITNVKCFVNSAGTSTVSEPSVSPVETTSAVSTTTSTEQHQRNKKHAYGDDVVDGDDDTDKANKNGNNPLRAGILIYAVTKPKKCYVKDRKRMVDNIDINSLEIDNVVTDLKKIVDKKDTSYHKHDNTHKKDDKDREETDKLLDLLSNSKNGPCIKSENTNEEANSRLIEGESTPTSEEEFTTETECSTTEYTTTSETEAETETATPTETETETTVTTTETEFTQSEDSTINQRCVEGSEKPDLEHLSRIFDQNLKDLPVEQGNSLFSRLPSEEDVSNVICARETTESIMMQGTSVKHVNTDSPHKEITLDSPIPEGKKVSVEVLDKIKVLEKDLKLVNEIQGIINGIKENYGHKKGNHDAGCKSYQKRTLLSQGTPPSNSQKRICALGKLLHWKGDDHDREKRFLIGRKLKKKKRFWSKLNQGSRFLGQSTQNLL